MIFLKNYTSIHNLPLKNWLDMHRTGDLKHLVYNGYFKLTKKQIQHLKSVYDTIQQEFIETFGLNDNLKKLYELRRDIQILKIEVSIEGNKSKKPFIKMKEAEIQEILNGLDGNKNKSFTAHLEKYMGFYIDEKKITVYEYHRYVELFNEELEQRMKENMQTHNGRRN